jgi:hypothetical protein
MWAPPVGGLFGFKFSSRPHSWKIWRKTISGGEEVLAGKWGGLFLGYLLWKKFIGSRAEGTTLYRSRPAR